MVTLAIDFYRSATTHPAVIRAGRWSLRLATRLLARAMNMPEPLLHSTGAFVVAQVQAVENRAVKTLCPIRLLRRLLVIPGRRVAANPESRGSCWIPGSLASLMPRNDKAS